MISEYSSSWEQLTDNVSSMLDVLKEVRDNLRDSLDDYDSDDDGDNDKTSSKGWGSDDAGNGPGVEKRADGIERGAIGSASDNDRVNMIKYLSTNDLKDGETPIIAHEGEVVLNSNQQEQLLSNVDTQPSSDEEAELERLGLKKLDPDKIPILLRSKDVIYPEQQKVLMEKISQMSNYVPDMKIPDYNKMLQNVNVKQQDQTVNISYGDMTFPNVQNAEDVVKEFTRMTGQALRQVVSKYK